MFGPYQPPLPRDLVHELWLLKQTTRKPMTQLLREAVAEYLARQPQRQVVYARRAGRCTACDNPIEPGTVITEIKPGVWVHGECAA